MNSLSGMPYHPFASKSQKETIFFLSTKGKLELAKENYSSFIYDGILTNEIVETCIFLGKLDVYKRCFKLPEDITKKPSKYVIEEIKQLYSATDWKYFKAKSIASSIHHLEVRSQW
ncbi:MAG: hypothetical protein IPF81_14625 [Bacteroidetes bacterium]|nr:hypothetical protein [Bacteroidota bacterium]